VKFKPLMPKRYYAKAAPLGDLLASRRAVAWRVFRRDRFESKGVRDSYDIPICLCIDSTTAKQITQALNAQVVS